MMTMVLTAHRKVSLPNKIKYACLKPQIIEFSVFNLNVTPLGDPKLNDLSFPCPLNAPYLPNRFNYTEVEKDQMLTQDSGRKRIAICLLSDPGNLEYLIDFISPFSEGQNPFQPNLV